MPAIYPFHRQLRETTDNGDIKNFGLWFNKLIPVDSENYKACDRRGNDKEALLHYKSQYARSISNNPEIRDLLEKKHINQILFYKAMEKNYRTLVFTAELITPLILGMGESHPSENALIFDHNTGIPYIPASSLKGIVRFAHSLGLIEDENGAYNNRFVKETKERGEIKETLDEADPETLIPQLFGGDERDKKEKDKKVRGQLIFLDAYPETIPGMDIDIMTPHYGDYYKDTTRPKAPADCQDPNPIEFLIVPEGTSYIFRILVPVGKNELADKAKTALKRALVEEGAGGKTSAGYGHFAAPHEGEPEKLLKETDRIIWESYSPEEQHKHRIAQTVMEIKKIPKEKQNEIDSQFETWQRDPELNREKEIARAFLPLIRKEKKSGGLTQKYTILQKILELETETNTEEATQKKEAEKPESGPRELSKKEKGIVNRMKKYIEKGSISKKDLKKLKEHKSLAPELYEQLRNMAKN